MLSYFLERKPLKQKIGTMKKNTPLGAVDFQCNRMLTALQFELASAIPWFLIHFKLQTIREFIKTAKKVHNCH
jgi:hypothetical protein